MGDLWNPLLAARVGARDVQVHVAVVVKVDLGDGDGAEGVDVWWQDARRDVGEGERRGDFVELEIEVRQDLHAAVVVDVRDGDPLVGVIREALEGLELKLAAAEVLVAELLRLEARNDLGVGEDDVRAEVLALEREEEGIAATAAGLLHAGLLGDVDDGAGVVLILEHFRVGRLGAGRAAGGVGEAHVVAEGGGAEGGLAVRVPPVGEVLLDELAVAVVEVDLQEPAVVVAEDEIREAVRVEIGDEGAAELLARAHGVVEAGLEGDVREALGARGERGQDEGEGQKEARARRGGGRHCCGWERGVGGERGVEGAGGGRGRGGSFMSE